jgi:ABC-type transporter Mla maintaining outer membrane lipid asymmetry permease subunit MlaE
MKIKNPFLRMVVLALIGALLGLFSGFILGWIMYGLGLMFYEREVTMGMYYSAPFLGMAFGTLIGAILGGIVGIKKMK